MTLKNKFVVITAGFAAIFAALMTFDRVRTTRTEMLGRVEDRANYIVSFITDVSADQMQQANHDAGLKQILKGFEHFSQISYLKVSDSGGRAIYRLSRPGISIDSRSEDADIHNAGDAVFDIRRDMMKDGKSLGTIQLGMSLEGVLESLEILMWRGIAVGIIFLLLITGSVWLLAVRLGRELEALLSLAGQMNSEALPAEPILDPGTDTGKIAFALRDTHSRLKEEESRRKEAETQKDDFFAMTVHDLKQPLTALKAAMDLLFSEEEAKNFSKEQIRSLANIAGTSLRMLNSMVVDVLNMAKIRSRDYSPEKDRVPLAAFMRECAEENSASVKAAGKKWIFSLPEDIGETWIFADHDMVKRVIGNLVLNAIQYTPAGGAIKLGVRFSSADKAAIYVSDEGEGIPDSFREEIFKKYKGMGKSSKNIGLGLAFCRMVAESHSAMMDVRSEMGKGTEVSFVIPVSR
ncbi:MAG: HAMP domain-containing sensor histidine kinase [Elusimicrobiales bacterium]|nr:HAMP domain-containing sensor histidine kinase [Elusimicrobiales bacterium]